MFRNVRGGVLTYTCAVLELLAVHPEYQRLGAGAALVKWGTQVADEKRLKVFLFPLFASAISWADEAIAAVDRGGYASRTTTVRAMRHACAD